MHGISSLILWPRHKFNTSVSFNAGNVHTTMRFNKRKE